MYQNKNNGRAYTQSTRQSTLDQYNQFKPYNNAQGNYRESGQRRAQRDEYNGPDGYSTQGRDAQAWSPQGSTQAYDPSAAAQATSAGDLYSSWILRGEHAFHMCDGVIHDNSFCICRCGTQYKDLRCCRGESAKTFPNTSDNKAVEQRWADGLHTGKTEVKNSYDTGHCFRRPRGALTTPADNKCLGCGVRFGDLAQCRFYFSPAEQNKSLTTLLVKEETPAELPATQKA